MSDRLPRWSYIFQRIIQSPLEKQRLASALGVSMMTITRWANGESHPQRPHLIRLLHVLQTDHRQEVLNALQEEYPDILSWLNDDTDDHIPSSFFAQVLSTRTTTTDGQRFWRISDMLLQEAVKQLDPNRLGIAVKIMQCVPPLAGGKVRSLRERTGRGTSPWTSNLEYDVHLLGLESLSGYAVVVRHIVKEDDLTRNSTIPFLKTDFEMSAAAHPIRSGGKIAGSLLASSTQIGYFSQQRISLLIAYSDLLALAFNPEEFYAYEDIHLHIMPPPKEQQDAISTFRQQVTRKLQEAARANSNLSSTDAETAVWQELESKFIQDEMNRTHDSKHL